MIWAITALFLGVASGPAVAQTDSEDAPRTDPGADPAGDVRIIEVSGLIDPVVKDFLLREMERAEQDDLLAVVLQVNSLGSVLDDDEFEELATRLRDASVQVAYWVGPSGSSALGGTAELAGVADIVAVSAGSGIGKTGPARLPRAAFPPAFGDATERLQTAAIGAEDAIGAGIFDGPVEEVSVLPTFLLRIPGYETEAAADGEPGLVALTGNEFLKLPLTNQLFHTVGSPEVAYLFFTGGLGLLIFELYTAGVGLAGLLGAFLLSLGSFGLANLPTRPLAIVLFLLAFLAMTVDIQTNLPRFYTAVGVVLFVLATFLIWDGVTMSWVTGLVGIVGAVLYAYLGMPTMVRTRFSSPVIGRKWLIGASGHTVAAIDADGTGTVTLHGAKWPAKAREPLAAKQAVEVSGVEQYTVVVQPVD